MLRIKIIVVDRTRSPFLQQGESIYLDRLSGYARAEWMEVRPVKIKKGTPTEKILDMEGDAIAKRLKQKDYIIALDRLGKTYTSEGLARQIEKLSFRGIGLAFIIGGPLGLSKKILGMADEIISLSQLTLTHEMSRLILLEQLYRAFTIMNNEKYHK
ncbi:MAG: 23S rRNA (pseudouridine(1915)-N(3))-methyltransferase RlmH [Desulfobacterales bacterium]|nr:23S rRNA (pseudouridine(1915)-N(3))-methyltransferase RlmH [Desulfobacterales bacterium]